MFLLSTLFTSLAFTYLSHAIPAAPSLDSSKVHRNATILRTSAPKIKAPISSSPSVLYTWSDDQACASTTTKASCAGALASICTSSKLDQSMKHDVDGCSVWYWFDAGNRLPTAAECSASYVEILATHNGFGSLGYGADGNRTMDPLYAVYPTGGNGNCFKAPGDMSPVLAMDALPDGKTSLKQCGGAMTTRDLEERGLPRCLIENLGWQTFCNGVCLSTVVATSWLTGPFAVAGWLACLGGCDYTGYLASTRCIDELDEHQSGGKPKRANAPAPVDKCSSLQQFSFQCPAWEAGLRSDLGCDNKT